MDEYIKIMKEDYSLLGNVILQSRGNMALDKFAMKCGYSPRVFQGYIRNEKTRKHNDWRGVKRLADASIPSHFVLLQSLSWWSICPENRQPERVCRFESCLQRWNLFDY